MLSTVERLGFELQVTQDLIELRQAYFAVVPRLLAGEAHGLYLHPGPGRRPVSMGTMPSEFMSAYARLGNEDDPVLTELCRSARVVTEHSVPAERWRASRSRKLLLQQGIRHTLKAPIRSMEGQVVGTVNIARSATGFTNREFELASQVGHEISTAVHRIQRQQRRIPTADAGSTSLQLAQLTDREVELVELVVQGRTAAEIAAELAISANTVKEHLKRIYRKLDVHNRVELVRTLSAA